MTTQRQSVGNEQFFTEHKTAKRLSSFLKKQKWFKEISIIVEPSAGDGAWLPYLDVDLAYDIEPNHEDVIKVDDFLKMPTERFYYKNNKKIFINSKSTKEEISKSTCLLEEDFKKLNKTGKVLYIGNPPFGSMGRLAKMFINACAIHGDYIAFILPASLAKITQIRQLNKNLHLIHQEDLLTEKFRFERDGKVVSTVFQIWEMRVDERKDPVRPKKMQCQDFSFIATREVTPKQTAQVIVDDLIKKQMFFSQDQLEEILKSTNEICSEMLSQRPVRAPDNADVAICTHGSAYGKVYTDDFKNLSTRTHRFFKIRGKKVTPSILATRLESLKPKFDEIAKYTVGATCISKEEILICYNEKYGEEETT
jgi:hypothetical protein